MEVFEFGNNPTHSYSEVQLEDLDVEKLQSALRKMVDHHEMLRAVFNGDENTQQVLPTVEPYVINVVDARHLSPEEKQAQLDIVRKEMSHHIFKVNVWPLFEVRVTQVEDALYHIHISIDLIIADARSVVIFLQTLADLYYKDISLSPLELSFRDYVFAEQV